MKRKYNKNIIIFIIVSIIMIMNISLTSFATGESWEPGETLYVVECHESISLRIQPSTSSAIIETIPLYSTLKFMGMYNDGFCMVEYKGKIGFVLAEYLDWYEPQVAIYAPMKVTNCNISVSLRSRPFTDANVLCQVPKGEIVYAEKYYSDNFIQVSYNGLTGYILQDYLTYID